MKTKKISFTKSLLLSLPFLFFGCIHSDNTAPIFTNVDSVQVSENQTAAITLSAIDTNARTITYSIAGKDATSFVVDTTSGVVTFKVAPDYEQKKLYTFIAMANNGTSISYQTITINIKDLFNPFQIAKISAKVPKASSFFGGSISMSGNYIVIGASKEDTDAINAGVVHLFKKDINNDINEIATIKIDSGSSGDNFGSSVSIDGEYIIIGASGESSSGYDKGSAYLYKISSDDKVSKIAKLSASDAEDWDGFGRSVSINAKSIVIGTEEADSAYLFKIAPDDSVTQTAIIIGDDTQDYDRFGYSTAIYKNKILIGAKDSSRGSGSVYLFEITPDNNISQISKIDAIESRGNFGNSVAIDEEYIVVGAERENSTDSAEGAAYIFKIAADNNISKIAKLKADNPTSGDYFGASVSINDKVIVIGQKANEQNSTNINSAYLFKIDSNDSVSKMAKLGANDDYDCKSFGYFVAIDKNYILISAPLNNIDSNIDAKNIYSAGNIYIFDTEPLEKIYIYSEPIKISLISEGAPYKYNFNAASPVGNITYSLSGADSENFVLNENNLSTTTLFDFESPVDSGADNNYSISVTLDDGSNAKEIFDLSFEVADKHYIDLAKLKEDGDFGESISLDKNYLVAGDWSKNIAYLYKILPDATVSKLATFQSEDNVSYGDSFGSSVSISGDYIIVGARGKSDIQHWMGAAYLFKINQDETVSQIARLAPDDSANGNQFGSSVSIDGEYIAIGAREKDLTEIGEGKVYLFKIYSDSNITQVASATASDASKYAHFGDYLTIDGNYIAIGSSKSDYLYKIDANETLLETTILQAVGGKSIDISANYITIGNDNNVSLFKIASNETVSKIATLTAKDGSESSECFGCSLSIDKDIIVIGANATDTKGTNAGSIYIFKIVSDQNITQLDEINAYDTSSAYYFGNKVSISGDNIAVQAGGNKSVYLFRKDLNQP